MSVSAAAGKCRGTALGAVERTHLIDRQYLRDARAQPRRLEQHFRLLATAVRERDRRHAGFLEQAESLRSIGVGIQLPERTQDLVGLVRLDVELRERRQKRRPSDLAQGMELTDKRQRRGRVQHPSEPGLERSLRRAKLAQTPADGRQIDERAHDIEDDCASDHGLS
jgi:hypothetical protein